MSETCSRVPMTRDEAKSSVHALRGRNPRTNDYMAYACPLCDAWHVAKRSRRTGLHDPPQRGNHRRDRNAATEGDPTMSTYKAITRDRSPRHGIRITRGAVEVEYWYRSRRKRSLAMQRLVASDVRESLRSVGQ